MRACHVDFIVTEFVWTFLYIWYLNLNEKHNRKKNNLQRLLYSLLFFLSLFSLPGYKGFILGRRKNKNARVTLRDSFTQIVHVYALFTHNRVIVYKFTRRRATLRQIATT